MKILPLINFSTNHYQQPNIYITFVVNSLHWFPLCFKFFSPPFFYSIFCFGTVVPVVQITISEFQQKTKGNTIFVNITPVPCNSIPGKKNLYLSFKSINFNRLNMILKQNNIFLCFVASLSVFVIPSQHLGVSWGQESIKQLVQIITDYSCNSCCR